MKKAIAAILILLALGIAGCSTVSPTAPDQMPFATEYRSTGDAGDELIESPVAPSLETTEQSKQEADRRPTLHCGSDSARGE